MLFTLFILAMLLLLLFALVIKALRNKKENKQIIFFPFLLKEEKMAKPYQDKKKNTNIGENKKDVSLWNKCPHNFCDYRYNKNPLNVNF